MLVLTRQPGQKILIGRDIELCVLSVRGHRVRVGISAPEEVTILRDELVAPHPVEIARHQAGDPVAGDPGVRLSAAGT